MNTFRIGLVEDNDIIREMLAAGLRLSGNEVVTYTNAQECMAALLGNRFNNAPLQHDILITDLDLGQSIDGAEMIRRLRQFIPAKELPCIIISGQDIVELNLLGQNLLDVPVIQKPITPGNLLKEVRRAAGAGKGS